MRIVFLTESYFPRVDGVTYTLKAWKQRLRERGHEVKIIYPGSPEYGPSENEIPVRSLPNPFYKGYRIPSPVRPSKIPDADIIHCHGPATLGWSGLLYSKLEDTPAVYTHHTPVEEYFEQAVKLGPLASLARRLYLPIENYYLGKFDVVTASTNRINRRVSPVQLPVGLDMEFFRPQEESILDGMDLETPVVGYSGRLSSEKNVGTIVNFAENFEGSVVIVGNGPQRERLEKKASGNVYFKDFLDREELPGFYSGLDVFITASTGDTLGLSPLEANACGTPVVAVDHPPFNETIGAENGERFTKGDMDNLSEAVINALEKDYSNREAVEKYSLSRTIDELESIYEEIGG